jgi:hypothetical protein
MFKYVLTLISLGALIFVFACGDDEGDGGGAGIRATPESQEGAEQTLCSSLSGFGDSLAALRDLEASSASAEDYEAAAADVRAAWDQVDEDAADVTEADVTALESAQDDLDQAIEDAPADEPVTAALGTLSDEIDAVQTALGEVGDGLGCPPVGS